MGTTQVSNVIELSNCSSKVVLVSRCFYLITSGIEETIEKRTGYTDRAIARSVLVIHYLANEEKSIM
jgi:hypothetical protein